MNILKHFLLFSVAVFATHYVVKGVSVNPFWVAGVVGACLVIINAIIKPVINILTLPINLITFGLFSVIINGAIFYILSKEISGFIITDFTSATLGALFVSVINWIGMKVFSIED